MSAPFGLGDPKKPITFDEMLSVLRAQAKQFPDRRTGKNISYPNVEDFALSAFSVFHFQHPSFLASAQEMEALQGKNNARTIFGINKIPSDNHIRDFLDEADPALLNPVFETIFDRLQGTGAIEVMRSSFNSQLLMAFDGLHFFESKKICCENCSHKTHKNGTTSYYHHAVTPVFVSPNCTHVIDLPPEFITPQDGSDKQDCELAAAKRWLDKHGGRYAPLGVTILGDDLYCRQPFCEQVRSAGYHFIFTCKPDSHKTLYEWIEGLEKIGAIKKKVVRRWTGKRHEVDTYRYVSDLPLKAGENALKVDWFELITTTESGEIIYRNAYATDHKIEWQNVSEATWVGRARWKIENENNNTLKTKGYHLEHSFGHGSKYLANLLAALNMLAFLFHTVLELFSELYQKIRGKLGARRKFFEHIKALTHYICFDGWTPLLVFMAERLELQISSAGIDSG